MLWLNSVKLFCRKMRKYLQLSLFQGGTVRLDTLNTLHCIWKCHLHSNPDTQNPHMTWVCKYFLRLSAVKRKFFPPLTSNVFTSFPANDQLRQMRILSTYTMKTTFLVHWRVSNLTIQPCLLHCSSCRHVTGSSYSFPAFTICIKSSHNLVVYWDILYKICSLLGYPVQDFKFTGISSTRFQVY